MAKTPRDVDEIKQRIMDAAERQFASKGLYGARVDEIAAESGINKRIIYLYYLNKEALYAAVLERIYYRLRLREMSYFEDDICPKKLIERFIINSFEFLSEDSNFVKLLLWENLNEARYMTSVNSAATKQPVIDGIRNVLSRGIEQGIFRADFDIEQTILNMIMFCFSYFSNSHTLSTVFHFDLTQTDNIAKRANHVVDIVMRYICA